jgi:hypothetical protein
MKPAANFRPQVSRSLYFFALPLGHFFHPRPCPFCKVVSKHFSNSPPSTSPTHLLPLLDKRRHVQHSLSSHLQTALHSSLPQLSLDLLTLARTLDLQTPFNAPCLLLAGLFDGPGQQIDNSVLLSKLDKIGLLAQTVHGAVPAPCCEVFRGQEWVRERDLGGGRRGSAGCIVRGDLYHRGNRVTGGCGGGGDLGWRWCRNRRCDLGEELRRWVALEEADEPRGQCLCDLDSVLDAHLVGLGMGGGIEDAGVQQFLENRPPSACTDRYSMVELFRRRVSYCYLPHHRQPHPLSSPPLLFAPHNSDPLTCKLRTPSSY